jgi:hypothetical protein
MLVAIYQVTGCHIPHACNLDTRQHATFISHTSQDAQEKRLEKFCEVNFCFESNAFVPAKPRLHSLTYQTMSRYVGCVMQTFRFITLSIFRVKITFCHADGSSMEMDVWYLILIYLFTATGLTPSGNSTLHIYTQTIHTTTQWNRIHRT